MWGGTKQYWNNYIGKTLEILNFESDSLHERHAKTMDKKVFLWQTRKKEKKKFKRRRDQLSKQKTSQTLRREVSEGVTYESSVGLNLDPTNHQTLSQNAFEMPAKISLTKLKGYEEITPPYAIRPTIVHLQYDSKQKYQFVIFDTVTTCTGKLKSSLLSDVKIKSLF